MNVKPVYFVTILSGVIIGVQSVVEPPPLPVPRCRETPTENTLFFSKNFPRRFNENYDKRESIDCTYELITDEDSKVLLTFYHFKLGYGYGSCSSAHISVYHPNETVRSTYCGETYNNLQIISENNNLTFQFYTDRYTSTRGWLASWRKVPASFDEKSLENLHQESGKYLVSYPTNFVRENNETVCVDLQSEHGPTKIDISFKLFNDNQDKETEDFDNLADKPSYSLQLDGGTQASKCVDVKIEDDPSKNAPIAGLMSISISDEGNEKSVYSVREFRFIQIQEPKMHRLIQTDKGTYKSGDTVKMRIIGLDQDLKTSRERVSEVKVMNPSFRTIQQWKDISLDTIVQKEFELFEESPLGEYTVEMFDGFKKLTDARFEVAEYVLPRFEVKIEPPAAIMNEAKETAWKVCAKYTHGAPVKGTIQASFWTPRYYSSWRGRNQGKQDRVNITARAEDECTQVFLQKEDMEKMKAKVSSKINLEVDFYEEGTGEKQSALSEPSESNVVDQVAVVKFGSSSNQFIVGSFPYSGEIKVENHDGSGRPNERVEVCTRLFRDVQEVRNKFNNMWSFHEDDFISAGEAIKNLLYKKSCQEVVTDEAGRVNFKVPLLNTPADVKKLSIKVTATDLAPTAENSTMKTPEGRHDVDLTHTNTEISLSANSKDKSELKCNQVNMVPVFIAGPQDGKLDLSYYVISGGVEISSDQVAVSMDGEGDEDKLNPDAEIFSILEEDVVQSSSSIIKRVELPISVDSRGFPNLQFVVMVNHGNETLTDSHRFNVEFCTENKVDLQLTTDKTTPRGMVSLEVTANEGSLCGLSLTDKSVDILGNDNKVNTEKISKLKKKAIEEKTSYYNQNFEMSNKCPELLELLKVFTDSGRNVISNYPRFHSCTTVKKRGDAEDEPEIYEYDAPQAQAVFASGGFSASDGVGTRFGGGAAQSFAPEQGLNKPLDAVRTEFPETWLFDLKPVDGSLKMDLEAPDTLTSWTAEAVCMNPQLGLGLAKPQNLIVSQDFFSDLRIPYSVKRGEVFPLNISVFNNVELDLPLKLEINSEKVEPETISMNLCVKGQTNKLVSIPTRANAVGDQNITVSLTVANHQDCPAIEQGVGYSDRLRKPLNVKPEGLPVEKVETELKCTEDGGEVVFPPLDLPDNVIENSARSFLHLSGDIMASSLQNLGNLVRLPTGCGEQNLVKLAPNVYLLEYLNSNDQSDKELEDKALRYMEVGYNRQQRYRHTDGSYSIWGGGDPKKGSTFLTAFVVKVFSQASKFIDVDEEKLQMSVNWLLDTQLETGCFDKRGYVYSTYLQGGNSDNSLSAFVLTALLEADAKYPWVNSKRLREAADCVIKSRNETDLYSMTVATHAAVMYKNSDPEFSTLDEESESVISDMVETIMSKSNNSLPGSRFWDQISTSPSYWWSYSRSTAVEMTAYNIMTLTKLNRMDEAVDAVKWLARQRNSQGGYVSTQDTVVALQALSVYGNNVANYKQNMDVKVSQAEEEVQSFSITEDNKQIQQTMRVPQVPGSVNLELTGSGCVLATSVLRYNIPEKKEEPSFTLKSNYKDEKLKINYSYTGQRKETGMVILEVEMVSGYKPYYPDSLVNEIDSRVQRVEVNEKENIVSLYFDEVQKSEGIYEVELTIKKEFEIEDLKPARISIYDYYKPEERHDIMYTLETVLETLEE